MVRDILAREAADLAVYAYGSRVTGGARPYSDLDLLVEGDSRVSLARLLALRSAFDESDLPIKVDVSDWRALSPGFQAAIGRDRELLQQPHASRPSSPG